MLFSSSKFLAHLVRVIFLSAALFLNVAPHSAIAGGFEVYGGSYTERDKLALPPVCRLILFEKPSAHQPEGQRVNGDLFSLPQYRMAKGNIHLHHYCYGMLSRFRYFETTSKEKRKLFSEKVVGELDYVIENMLKDDRNWAYFDQLFYEQADMLFITGKYPEATARANKALAVSPGYSKAHALLSDIYLKIGKRDLSIKQLEAGLALNPSVKSLRNRLREIDPNHPILKQPIPELVKKDDAVPASPELTRKETSNESPESGATATGDIGTAPAQAAPEKKDLTIKQPPDNPYCRFCP